MRKASELTEEERQQMEQEIAEANAAETDGPQEEQVIALKDYALIKVTPEGNEIISIPGQVTREHMEEEALHTTIEEGEELLICEVVAKAYEKPRQMEVEWS